MLGMATSRLRALGSECPQAEDLASASAQWLRHTAPSHKRTNRSTCVLCATTLATTRSTTNGYFHSEEDAQSHRELGYRAGTNGADVIGLNLDPPAHAAVFCVDEKTAIQALDRKNRCCLQNRIYKRPQRHARPKGRRHGVALDVLGSHW